MASRRTIIIKICLFLHILEVLLGSVLTVFSFLLQNAANVGLAETPSWLGIPCAVFGLVGIIVIVLNKLKEELVFVLVFHCLVVGLCIISLVLVAPKVSKWQPVASFQSSGYCLQVENNCNCTRSLPTKVLKCSDLSGIYELALIIAVIVGLCLVNAVFAAYFDFIVINKYVPRDNYSQSSTMQRKRPYDEEELVNSFGEIGHIGPLNTPDLTPRASDDALNSILLNRCEPDKSAQEEDPEGKPDQMGSSASLPAEQSKFDAVIDPTIERVKGSPIPRSVAGSRQSIKSRKDNLLRRLQSVQSKSLDDAEHFEDEKDDEILSEIERSTKSSSKSNVNGQVTAGKYSPSVKRAPLESRGKLTDKEMRSEDRILAEKLRSSASLEQPKNKALTRLKQVDPSARSSSEANILGSLSNREGDRKASDRSQSERDVFAITQKDGYLPNFRGPGRLPGRDEDKITNSAPFFTNDGSNEREIAGEEDVQDDELKSSPARPFRRSGFVNKELSGLPPLPLKEFQDDLTVQERTFSAPTLPFVDIEIGRPHHDEAMERPGSSGSQVLAKSRREFSKQVRNDLIDPHTFSDENKFAPFEDEADLSSDTNVERKNSFDTDSTDIEISDKVDGSDITEDPSKKPRWHPPWQLKQEIVAHKDSVPVLAIEPRNRWFASGSTDRTIKIWDINTGHCRLTVKAHKAGVRALAFGSSGHRFIFSAADDRQLLCTDIEVNKVVSHFPDQSSVIYAMAMYRQADLLVTCGRDKYVKIWDTREKKCVRTMRGHLNTTSSLAIVQNSGQIVSGSHDSTMRIWDIGEGRCTQILTGHEKSVRSIVVHPEEPIISSASTERIIHWSMPDGEKIKEITPSDISINCISVNPQGALVAAGSNGVIHLWDWKSGHKFQKIHRTSVYESQEVPICVFSVVFDKSGSRLLVADASNVIKLYGEAYTRVRRRHGNVEDDTKVKSSRESKFATPDYAFI